MKLLIRTLSFNFSATITISRYLISGCLNFSRLSIFIRLIDAILWLYFWICGLSPCTLDLNDKTTMHFWITNHRRFNKPNLVMIHGYGGYSRWQFAFQVAALSRRFNLYVPDLLFFGKSSTTESERSEYFQAKCVVEGLSDLGVKKFCVYAISYGGFVGYRMAEMYPDVVEKVVIVSSAVAFTEDMKVQQVQKVEGDVSEFFVPKTTRDLRLLVNLCVNKNDPLRWVPNFVLRQFITVMYGKHRKEQIELLRYLLGKDPDPNLHALTQETLLIWGDKDNIFPLDFAHLLQRHLPVSKLAVIKDTGHAANLEAPYELNRYITSFLLGPRSSSR